MQKMQDFILSLEGEIFGERPEQWGNYQEQNLDMAKYYIAKHEKALLGHMTFVYLF